MTNAGRSRFIASQGGLPVVLYPTDQFPTIASIPTGAVVIDTTDGVVKRKVGNYLVDIQYNVIGYGPIASAPTSSAGNLGSFYLETGDPLYPNGRLWNYRNAEIAERNANELASYSMLSKKMCFVKQRTDYTEFSVYAPTDSTGTKFARWYFATRLNVGAGGFPRMNGACFASLTGEIGDASFTQSNPATHITSPNVMLDIILGNGNIEQAVYTRKTALDTADFVGGVHGKELLVSYDLYIDGVLTPYSDITINAKIVCERIDFVAKTKLAYPSDASTYWCELTYTGRISNGAYTCTVDSNVLIESEVRNDYVAFNMAPGSTNTQRYSTGFDLCTLGNSDFTLNQFDNFIYRVPSFTESSFRNAGHLCVGRYKTKTLTDASQFITKPATIGTYTSRTDKFNKVYFQSKNEAWDLYPVGYAQTYTNQFIIRNGDTTSLDWVDKNVEPILAPYDL